MEEKCAIEHCMRHFLDRVAKKQVEVYNEFSLQHELGIALRGLHPEWIVQFERNVGDFGGKKEKFTKREIDISVFSRTPDGEVKDLLYAIELKFPRNEQYPEQMFSFCKDIQFAEELVAHGFQSAAVLTLTEDPNFYRGLSKGIYEYFRSEKPLTGIVQKPTGAKDDEVRIRGEYVIKWVTLRDSLRYFMVVATK
jgi:hypothetical protein